jgi:acyl-CoA thioesterase I
VNSCDVSTRQRMINCLLSLVILLTAACSTSYPAAELPADGVILAFGDSITYGTGAGREDAYPQVLEQLTGRRVINGGVPGETTAEGLKHLPALLDAERPDLLILCLGGNDFLRKLDDREVEKNVAAMVKLARGRGVEVVLIGVPRVGVVLKTHPLYYRIAKEQKVPLEGKVLQRILSERSLRANYIHPNAEGYRQLAEAVVELLAKTGFVSDR